MTGQTRNRKQCPHCGLWLDVVVNWNIEQSYSLEVQGVVPKKGAKARATT